MPKPEGGKIHALNLRKLPDELYWKLKQRAAENRLGLEAYATAVLRLAVEDGSKLK